MANNKAPHGQIEGRDLFEKAAAAG